MDVSHINLLGFLFTVLMSVVLILVPRRFAFAPLAIISCYITLGQMANFAGLHFYVIRILVLVGWLRLIVQGELTPRIQLNAIDKSLICWVASSIIAYTFMRGTWDAFINRLGFAYNAIGMFFLFRFLIRDLDDIMVAIKGLAVIIVPLAILMIIEASTGRNIFSIFGGVSEFSMFREGNLRAQGPFTHPIMAGTLGATLAPLFVFLWFRDRSKLIGAIGFVAATVIMSMSHSSGPLLGYFFGILGLLMWAARKQMRVVRWAVVILLVGLHVVMKAPVWALIGRLCNIVGGDGWHRVELINTAVKHFDEWWLVGTKYTIHWLPFSNEVEPGMADITNEYILQGVNGGLITLSLFIVMIAISFRSLGGTLQAATEQPLSVRIMVWSMGAALLSHLMSFVSVAYFDQVVVFWYLLLAAISGLANLSFTLGDSLPQGTTL